jgi:hypothetical protein
MSDEARRALISTGRPRAGLGALRNQRHGELRRGDEQRLQRNVRMIAAYPVDIEER